MTVNEIENFVDIIAYESKFLSKKRDKALTWSCLFKRCSRRQM